MAFGKPSLTSIKAGDVRELQNLVTQLTQRITAIENALTIGNGQTLQDLLQTVMSQPDGTVVKKNSNLTTQP
jgi:sulfur carrier protein ThiS